MLHDFIILTKILGIPLIDTEDFIEMVLRFVFNSTVVLIIVRYLYFPITKRKDYLFTYLSFSVIIFFLCHLLANVKLGLGFALGLFAIFGIIRYRTNPIPIKEMTYLFIIIGISVINALANKKVSYAELITTNFLIIAVTYLLEKKYFVKAESRKIILYEKIDLIIPGKREELIADLKERTGLNIHRAEIGRINFLRDTARVRIYYYENSDEPDNNDG
ncbi:MAG: DUF4956 domain-containing protein [Bacteroidetes bacterium]|nr:DUF4956 domain-containing protein [Bacteroidia bacterium]PCH66196.1 MAG: DUF4956 domain-containing protein [Bacteroidota bacterium]